ncbi:MAG: hypothetical protein E7Z63_02645 [Thermoplasmata archaeon]|nr:hypothetical protein [Thermoplasmata archaeon]
MEGGPASGFLELVRTRHETDRVLSVVVALLVVIINFVLFAAFDMYVHLGERNCLFFLTMGIGTTLVTVCAVIRARNRAHIARDMKVALSLIDFLRGSGADVSGYSEYEETYSKEYRTVQIAGPFFIVIMLGMMPFWTFFTFNINPDDWYSYLWPLIAVLVPLVFFVGSVGSIFALPAHHDMDQVGFYEKFCESCRGIGIDINSPEPAVKRKVRYAALPLFILCLFVGIFATTFDRDFTPMLALIGLVAGMLTAFTFMSLMSVSAMNHHVVYQWTYEEYVLSRIGPGEQAVFGDDESVGTSAVRKKRRLPLALRFAELFLVVMCAMYLIKIFAIGVDFNMGYYGVHEIDNEKFPEYAFMTLMNAVLFVITMVAIFSIRSRNIKAIRKVLRSCITFSASAVITETFIVTDSFTHYFDVNLYLTLSILYFLFILVLTSEKSRGFFTPYGMKIPSVGRTLRYSLFGKMNFEEAETEESVPEETSAS